LDSGSRLSRIPGDGTPIVDLPYPGPPPDDPRPLPGGRLAKVLRYACALHAHEQGIGEDYRAREWLRLDPRDQAIILHWLSWVHSNVGRARR